VLYSLVGRVPTSSRPTAGATAFGVLLRSGADCGVCQIRSGDADDRGNLSRSTRLGLLKCVERRRRLEGLLGYEGDRKLEKVARAAYTGCSRPASLGGDWGRVRGRCLDRRLNPRSPTSRGRPAPACNRLRSTNNWCDSRLRCLVHSRLNHLALNGATAGRWFQSGMASSVGRTMPRPGRRKCWVSIGTDRRQRSSPSA
jgi:hypothetical protein